MAPEIVFENEDFLALNKPAGMLVEQVKAVGKIVPEDRSKVVQGWLDIHYPGAKLVHRLDRETSGVLLASRTDAYYDYLKQLFRERTIYKTYRALVHGHLRRREDTINAPIGIKQGMVRHTIHDKAKNKRSSITSYRLLRYFCHNGHPFSEVELYPKTGRTHQIRVHMNSIHHPVIGDKLYGGSKQAIDAPRHLLHAYAIEFSLPSENKKRMRLEAPLPQLFSDLMEQSRHVNTRDCDQ